MRKQKESADTLGLALAAIAELPWLRLFPVAPGNKAQPLLKNYLNRASNCPTQISRWHSYWKKRFDGQGCWWGVAPALSGIVVADVDTKDGKQGQHTFDHLDLLYGWPRTRTIITPSGGRHHWYRGRHLFSLGSDDSNHPGIDFAQYSILPGCMKAEGTGYFIIDNHSIVRAPSWLYVEARRPTNVSSSVEQDPVIEPDQPSNIAWAIDFLQHDAPPSIAGKGGERVTLGVAGVLKDMGISETTALELMNENYNVPGKCDPIWSLEATPTEDSLAVKVHNAFTYMMGRAPGASTAEAEFASDDYAPEPLDKRTAAIVARQQLERTKAKLDKANGIKPRRRPDKKRIAALKRAAAMAKPYQSKPHGR